MGECWSDLPECLLELIMDHLEFHGSDVVRCQAVCSTWHSAAQSVLTKRRQSVPWLLLPNHQDPCTRTLLQPHTRQTLTIHLPELHHRWICTATNGWLVTIGLSPPYAMHLLNPLTREEISIPSRTTFLYPQLDGDDEVSTVKGFIVNAIVSTTPSDPNCLVLVIYGTSMHLALCKPRDERWTHVDDTTGVCKLGTLEGICNFNLVFYKATRMFYIVDKDAFVKKLELELGCGSLSPRALRIASPLKMHLEQKYLVESVVSGDFWLILRSYHMEDDLGEGDELIYHTKSFEVWRMDLVTKEMSEVDSLGGESLFLGHNGSISVIIDGSGWCRPNCIYFLDDYVEAYEYSKSGCHDMGVFDLGTMRVEKEEFVDIVVGNEKLRSRIGTTPFHWINFN